MATVPENLNKILQARYGEEVRGAIYDSIAQCYKDSTGESLANLERRALANPVVNGGYIEHGADLEPPYDDLNTFEANTIIIMKVVKWMNMASVLLCIIVVRLLISINLIVLYPPSGVVILFEQKESVISAIIVICLFFLNRPVCRKS